MHGISRREVLKSAVAMATVSAAGCGGSADADTPAAPAAQPVPPSTPPPAWVSAMVSGTWSQVPMAATLAAVDPMQSARYNPRHPDTPEWSANLLRQTTVVDAWCGAAYDETTDTMWLGLGGGHQDYAGNEIYRCGFHHDSPAWEMRRPPSGAVGNELVTNDGREATGVYSDGRPRACHSYNNWVYVPGAGPALAAHPAVSWGASDGKRWSVWLREIDGEHTFGPEVAEMSLSDILAAGACYDASRHAVWYKQKGMNKMFRYAVPRSGPAAAGTWARFGADFQTGVAVSLCHLPEHDCLLVGTGGAYSPGSEGWLVYDCVANTWHRPAFNGTLPGGFRPGESQPRWVPPLQAACVWDNTTETTHIVKLQATGDPRRDPWAVTALPVTTSNTVVPAPKAANGTFGRFAYSPRMGGFVVFSSHRGPTYFYKL
jgi:hypothetical protein